MTLYDELILYKDEEYKNFQSKLIPNINNDTMIGVRTPILRKIAKSLFNTNKGNEFLKDLPHKYFEENLIHFFYSCND